MIILDLNIVLNPVCVFERKKRDKDCGFVNIKTEVKRDKKEKKERNKKQERTSENRARRRK